MSGRLQPPGLAAALGRLTRRVAKLERLEAAAGQVAGGRFVIKVFHDTEVVTTGNGKFIFAIPEDIGGANLVVAEAFVTTVSSSGFLTIQIRNVSQAADMLTERIRVDQSEFTSYTASQVPVIDTANDDVATGDLIAVDVDAAGTLAYGLGVILGFQ